MAMNTRVLVTGGSGFLGSYCILALLEKGYKVRTTVRSLEKADAVRAKLVKGGASDVDKNLSFVAADLTSDKGWPEAVDECKFVMHVASPFPMKEPEDENEVIVPARDGTLRVLKAATDAKVERVVLTSSFAAIGYAERQPGHVFTEVDYTSPDAKGISPYARSKTIAEKAAWDYMKQSGSSTELTVINPMGIFGPVLSNDYATSIGILKGLMAGLVKETPKLAVSVVDVRDVANLHVLAMTSPKAAGERFLASTTEAISLYDAAQIIREERPELAKKFAELTPLPEALYPKLCNQKAITTLQWQPRDYKTALLASVDSLVALDA